jgi:hypothetical protein
MWYAVATRGSGTAYQRYAFGNARTFSQRLIAEFNANGWKLKGTIVYHGIFVRSTYLNTSAVVRACVDTSGLYRVSAQTGAVLGSVFGTTCDHYLEEAFVSEKPGGRTGPGVSWGVIHVGATPASAGGTAGACT